MIRFWYDSPSNSILTNGNFSNFTGVPGQFKSRASGDLIFISPVNPDGTSSRSTAIVSSWQVFVDRDGNALGTDAATTVTALNAILAGPRGAVTFDKSVGLPRGGHVPMLHEDGYVTESGAQKVGGNLVMPESTQLQSRAAFLGSSARLLSTGSFLNIQNTVTNKVFEVVDYEAPSDEPSGAANRIKYPAGESSFINVFSAPTNDRRDVAINNKSFEWQAGFFGRVWEFRFTFASAVTNFRMRIFNDDTTSNDDEVYTFPSEMAWLTGEGGNDYASGEVDISLEGVTAPMFVEPNITYRVEMQADSGTLTERASDSLPAMGIRRQLGERVFLQDRGALFNLGTLGNASADFQDWPAANKGEYVTINADITIGGTDLKEDDWWVCTTDDTAGGTGANWTKVVFPSSGSGSGADVTASLTAHTIPRAEGDTLQDSVLVQIGNTVAIRRDGTFTLLAPESGATYRQAPTTGNVVDVTLTDDYTVNSLGLSAQSFTETNSLGLPVHRNTLSVRIDRIIRTDTNAELYNNQSGATQVIRHIPTHPTIYYFGLNSEIDLPQNVSLRFEIEVDADGAQILTQTDNTTFALYGHGGFDYPVIDSGRQIATSGGLEGGGDLSADRTLSIADDGVSTAKVADAAITAPKLATSAFANGTQVNQASATDLIVSPYRLQQRMETLSYDRFHGTIGASGADISNFPAGNRGDYVIATSSPGTVNGIALVAGVTYRCTTNNTAANTPANWRALPFPDTFTDSGWINLSVASPWTNVGGNWPPSRCRKIDEVVHVQVTVSRTVTGIGVFTPVSLPSGFRPSHFFPLTWLSGSGANTFFLPGLVRPGGAVEGINLPGNSSISRTIFSFPVG